MRLRFSLVVLSLLSACSDYNFSEKQGNEQGADPRDTAVPDSGTPSDSGETGDTAEVPPDTCEEVSFPEDEIALVDECSFEEVVGTFIPVIEWTSTAPGDSYTTPVIGQLTDDNGDGLYDDNDIPDIVVANAAGTVFALSGDDGRVHWSAGALGIEPMTAAIGDLDGDGRPDVVGSGAGATTAFVGDTGVQMWTNRGYSGGVVGYCGAVGLYDLDADGYPEVVIGRNIQDGRTGALLGVGAHGDGSGHSFAAPMGVAADIDQDGMQEVVVGNALYRSDGSTIWYNGQSDGFVAIGNFDSDVYGEIVVTSQGTVRLQDDDGTVLWTRASVAGNTSGPPTVADFDSDGLPEVGIAGNGRYIVLDTDGTTLWSRTTQDFSSGFTGSAVFDFEGDGEAEVVYADEVSVWVFDGATGTTKMEETRHSSATCSEYPSVADVDNDGHAEIIYTSGRYSGGETGVTVIGDADDSWRRGRPVWNQHAYAVTNVDDDATIPTSPVTNWHSYNTFRSGDTLAGSDGLAPDLVPIIEWVCGTECDLGHLYVWARIANQGHAAVETPVELTLFGDIDGEQLELGTVEIASIGEGVSAEGILFDIAVTEDTEVANLMAVVDGGVGGGRVEECDETNNEAVWTENTCW